MLKSIINRNFLDTWKGCNDTDHGAFDKYGDTCAWYDTQTRFCGDFDDNDFTAYEMCCACRGIITILIR